MKGDALSWFKWMHQNNQLLDWGSFTKALELRFVPSTYANHQEELFKLRQMGIVSEYQVQFEKLGNRVFGLSPEAILNCFISDLSPDIRNEIAIQKPHSIAQAISLAKLIEAKIKHTKPKFQKGFSTPSSQPYNLSTTHNNPHSTTNPASTNTLAAPIPLKPPNPNPLPNKIHIRCLNQTHMQERRVLALCYICDKKFIMGHKCTTNRFLLSAHALTGKFSP
jgi:hypothetical protein